MDFKLLPLSGAVFCIIGMICFVITAVVHGLGDNNGPAQGSQDYIPVLYVTASAIFFLYTLFWNQSYTAMAEHQRLKQRFEEGGYQDVESNHGNNQRAPSLAQVKYGGNNKAVRNANRIVGNFQEQMVPFLVSMYLYATYVSASGAAQIGWAWLFFRSYYPFAFTRWPWIFASTLPAYGCVWFMLLRAVYAATTMML